MKFSEFLEKMFSEPTGQPSFGRGSFGFVIVCAMALIAFQVKTNRVYSLTEWAMFLATVGGVTYGVNRVSAAWGTNKVESTPVQPEDKAKGAGAP